MVLDSSCMSAEARVHVLKHVQALSNNPWTQDRDWWFLAGRTGCVCMKYKEQMKLFYMIDNESNFVDPQMFLLTTAIKNFLVVLLNFGGLKNQRYDNNYSFRAHQFVHFWENITLSSTDLLKFSRLCQRWDLKFLMFCASSRIRYRQDLRRKAWWSCSTSLYEVMHTWKAFGFVQP